MAIQPNWKPRERYLWGHAATLACWHLMGDAMLSRKDGQPAVLGLYVKRPKEGDYHRIRLEMVRTKKEAAAMNRKLAKARKRFETLISARSGERK